jgi:hypothetical protein
LKKETCHVKHEEHAGDLFDCEFTVHHKFVHPGKTFKQHCYWQVLQCLREQVCQKHPKHWWNQDRMMHRESVPADIALSVQQCLAPQNMNVVPTILTQVIWPLAISFCF